MLVSALGSKVEHSALRQRLRCVAFVLTLQFFVLLYSSLGQRVRCPVLGDTIPVRVREAHRMAAARVAMMNMLAVAHLHPNNLTP